MKKLILATAVMAAFAASVAQAEDKKPDNEVSFNADVVTDYRYRGISQSRREAAVQGGADYVNNPTGIYVGTWLSTIKWTQDAGGSGTVEWDVYAGKKGQITKDVSYDVGVLTYVYPSNSLHPNNANTTEIYGQLGFGPAYVKYSHAVTNLFGFNDSKNSGYLDVGANVDVVGGYVVNLHAGHQNVKHNGAASYSDYKIGVSKDYGIVAASLAFIGTNADKVAYASPYNGKFLGKNMLVASVSKTF
jgi:uncharacterized protein (TIGR02001 family)